MLSEKATQPPTWKSLVITEDRGHEARMIRGKMGNEVNVLNKTLRKEKNKTA